MPDYTILYSHYRYVGRHAPGLYGKECFGIANNRTGKRVWGTGPGPRSALVWFPAYGLVNVPTRTLRKVKYV